MTDNGGISINAITGVIVTILVIGVIGMVFFMMADGMMGVTEKVSSPSDNFHPIFVNSSKNYTNAPVLIEITQATYPGLFNDIKSNQNNFRIMTDDKTILPHYTEEVSGSDFKVWVNVPSISNANTTRVNINPLHYSSYDHSSASTFSLFDIDAESIYRFEGGFTDQLSNHDGTAIAGAATTTTGNYGKAGAFSNTAKQAVNIGDLTGVYESGITVAGWVNNSYYAADNYQAIASIKGFDDPFRFNTTAAAWSLYDTKGTAVGARDYYGAVTDGRYVYFVPYGADSAARVVRYDTTLSFTDAGSWSLYDTKGTAVGAQDYIGAVTDGRYVYFVPVGADSAARVVRYDTTLSFTDAGSWSLYDTKGTAVGAWDYYGAVTDGRYVYFVPVGADSAARVVRYDTTLSFTDAGSWSLYDTKGTAVGARDYYGAVTDGRYVYFVPYGANSAARVVRYDTTLSFTDAGSWSLYDIKGTAVGARDYRGAVTDGRYVYFVPYGADSAARVVRYDTTLSFTDAGSWSLYDTKGTAVGARDYIGAVTDGRYVYFVPYAADSAARVVRYDTTLSFTDAGSWSLYDIKGTAVGARDYRGAVTDGRYVYFVPVGADSAARVVRYDTTSDLGFALAATSPSNSFGGMPPGPSFVVGTAATSAGDGQRAAYTNKNLTAGWHHVAGTYDGQTVSLYVDGTLVGQNTYADSADITSSSVVAYLAGAPDSSMFLNGNLDELVIVPGAMTASEIATLATRPNYLDEVTLNTGDAVVALQYDVESDVVTSAVDTSLEHGDAGATYERIESHMLNVTDFYGMAASLIILVMIAGIIMVALVMWMNRD